MSRNQVYSSPEEHREALAKAVATYTRSISTPEPIFSLNIGWARDYDALFATKQHVTDETEVLDKAITTGRVIISGRGGGGKTLLLHRLMRRAAMRSIISVFVDLKLWTGRDYDLLKEWTRDDIGDASTFIIERFSHPNTTALELDWLPPNVGKLLLVDGLNEIAAPTGQEILRSLDEVVRNQMKMSVVVADRLIRRELPGAHRWAIGEVLPLTDAQIVKYAGRSLAATSDRSLLTSPFFLDAAIQYGLKGTGRARASYDFLVKHAGLNDAEVESASEAAFGAYAASGTRTFDVQAFVGRSGQAVWDKLLTAGVVHKDGFFVHHLIHDYLAARHVSRCESHRWTPQVLNTISFDASSFDAVALAFEQLDGERAEGFLRKLYDWNLYAAGYALGEVDYTRPTAGAEIQTIIFAMLAEKRFDIVIATQQRAADALSLIRFPDVLPFRAAEDLRQVIEAVHVVTSEQSWFREWRDIFSLTSHDVISDDWLGAILHEDSVKGWTVANVAKRTATNAAQQSQLRGWLSNSDATARWRIAHVLGSFASASNVVSLTRLLDDDPDASVRYGAIRSLVEIAHYADESLRNEVVSTLQSRAPVLAEKPKLLAELRRALLIDAGRSRSGWLALIRAVTRSFFMTSSETHVRDEWRAYLGEAESMYSNPGSNNSYSG